MLAFIRNVSYDIALLCVSIQMANMYVYGANFLNSTCTHFGWTSLALVKPIRVDEGAMGAGANVCSRAKQPAHYEANAFSRNERERSRSSPSRISHRQGEYWLAAPGEIESVGAPSSSAACDSHTNLGAQALFPLLCRATFYGKGLFYNHSQPYTL